MIPHLALLVMAIILSKQVSGKENPSKNDFIILRSKSYNTMSQKELIGDHEYSIYDIKKGNTLVDFNIEIRKTNITSLSETFEPITIQTENMVQVKSFFLGKKQRNRLSAIITNKRLELRYLLAREATQKVIYSMSLTDTTHSLNKLLNCDSETFKISCDFISLEHGPIEGSELILVQVKLKNTASQDHNDFSLKLLTLAVKYTGGQPEQQISEQVFDLNRLENSRKAPCKRDEMTAIDNFELAAQSLYFGRFCPLDPYNEEETNYVQFEVITQAPSGELTKTIKGIYHNFGYTVHQRNTSRPFRLIRIIPSITYTIFATANHISYIHKSSLVKSLDEYQPSADLRLEVNVVLNMSISNIFCNFINSKEVCCTSKLRLRIDPGREVYQLMEFIMLDSSILPIVIPVRIDSSEQLVYSLNTKNYIILRYAKATYFCYRKETTHMYVGKVNKNSEPKNKEEQKPCALIVVDDSYELVYINKLLFEENYSNPIDGYVTIAMRKIQSPDTKKNPTPIELRVMPMLITGPYFTFSLDMRLTQFVCKRYFQNCADTAMTFVHLTPAGLPEKTYHKPVFIIDENFNSVLSLNNEKSTITLHNTGKLVMILSQHYFGDVTDFKVIRPLKQNSRPSFVPPSQPKETFIGKFSRPFLYVFKDFLGHNLGVASSRSLLDWAFLRMNSDRSITVGVSYSHHRGIQHIQTIYKTSPPISFVPIDKNYTKKISTEIFSWTNKRHIVSLHSVEKDSLDLLEITVTQKEIKLELLQFMNYPSSSVSVTRIQRKPGEAVRFFRSLLDRNEDMVAVITDKTVYIRRASADKSDPFPPLLTIDYEDFLMGAKGGAQSVKQVLDVLLVKNIMIMDLVVEVEAGDRKEKEKKMKIEKRVYIYNLDLERSFFYSYGYIQIESDTSPLDYSLFYSKEVDKAILIYTKKAVIVEYSLDNVFLDLGKLGREIFEDARSDMKRYGNITSLKLIRTKLASAEVMAERTLFLPFENSYVIVLESSPEEPKNKQEFLVLVGEISERALSVFKSYRTSFPEGATVIFPDIIAETEVLAIPLFIFPKDNKTLSIQFLWLKDFVSLDYKNIFEGEPDTVHEVELEVTYKDPNGNYYEDLLKVTRDDSFSIKNKEISHEIDGKVKLLSFEDYGISSQVGINCVNSLVEPKGDISRNNIINLVCAADQYNASLAPGFVREGVLELDSTEWKNPVDLVRVSEPTPARFRDFFCVLDRGRLIVFQARGSHLVWYFAITSGEDSKLSDCISIKYLKISDTLINISVFCPFNNSFVEKKYLLNTSVIAEVEASGQIVVKVFDLPTFSYRIPEKIWRSINKDKNNMQVIDNLAFVKTDVSLFSIGSKTSIDIYYHNGNARTQQDRFVLINSTLSEKYSEHEVWDFRVYPHWTHNEDTDKEGEKAYKFLQVNVNQATAELQVVHSMVYYRNPDDVLIKPTGVLYEDLDVEGSQIISVELFADPERTDPEDGTVEFVHRLFVVVENHIYEYRLVEKYKKGGVPLEADFVMESFSAEKKHRQYNYAGLCDFDSVFQIDVSEDFVLVNCIPNAFDSLSHSLVVYRLPDSSKPPPDSINPSYSIPQLVGYTEKNSNQILLKSRDGTTRIVKTTPRGLVDLYRIENYLSLHISVEPKLFSDRHLWLMLKNDFVTQAVKIGFSKYNINYVRSVVGKTLEDTSLVFVCGVYFVCILGAYSMSGIVRRWKRVSSRFRKCWKKNRLVGRKQRPTRSSVVGSLRDRDSFNTMMALDDEEEEGEGHSRMMKAILNHALNDGFVQVGEGDHEERFEEEEENLEENRVNKIADDFFDEVFG